METLKRNWLRAIGVLTLALGVIFAVNALEKKVEIVEKKNTQTEVSTLEEWHFNGTTTETEDPLQYSKFATETCDDIKTTVCKLNAPALASNSNHPDLNYVVPGTGNQTVKQRIAQAISSKMPNETVLAFRSE